ncbi:MAG: PP2C family protein-serine/threonine phosphatase, partial [Planctomycetes bacterium]|nr:PP2C family protein-serine/threonine phosphatase [Planctomycetota bacterium]
APAAPAARPAAPPARAAEARSARPPTRILEAAERPGGAAPGRPGPEPEFEIVQVHDLSQLKDKTVRLVAPAEEEPTASPPRRAQTVVSREELDSLPLMPLEEDTPAPPVSRAPAAATAPAAARESRPAGPAPGEAASSRGALEQMVLEINAEMQRLRAQLEAGRKVERSLEEARKQQRQMLPTPPPIPGGELGVVYRPFDLIGGDFYNFLRVDDGLVGIAIGDISGHGLEAALVVGMLKKALDIRGAGCPSPAEVVRQVNRDITPDLNPATFVTMTYAVVDMAARRLCFARAGHTPLILFNPHRERPVSVINARGMVMGMDQGAPFDDALEEGNITLKGGDLLVQFTDGVLETMNEAREEFGFARIVRAVERYGGRDVAYLLGSMERHLDAYRGQVPQRDDLTILALKVH